MGCCANRNSEGAPGAFHSCEDSRLSVRCCVTLLKGYKRYISPFFPPSCRFTPTCSEYAIDAIRSRGIIRGIFLATFRLLRCHPFAKGGYDPVD